MGLGFREAVEVRCGFLMGSGGVISRIARLPGPMPLAPGGSSVRLPVLWRQPLLPKWGRGPARRPFPPPAR